VEPYEHESMEHPSARDIVRRPGRWRRTRPVEGRMAFELQTIADHRLAAREG
jgi:hypothetical protein